MDAYSEEDLAGLKYAKSRISNRQVDTLIGLAKGIIADGVVTQEEAELLLTWLANNRFTDNPLLGPLLDRIADMLSDDHLDGEEQEELLGLLIEFAGDPGSMGELLKSTTLPLDDPRPDVHIPGRNFLFTGTCAYGTRKVCESFIREQGGDVAKGVTKKLDYLVIGTYVTQSWMHESYGRKIEKAIEYRVPLRCPGDHLRGCSGLPGVTAFTDQNADNADNSAHSSTASNEAHLATQPTSTALHTP